MAGLLGRTEIIRVILLLFGVYQILLAGCPPGWFAWRDSCYILLPEQMDWWKGLEICHRPGSSMVVPDSQEEQDFIWQEMRKQMGELLGGINDKTEHRIELWIGCIDVNSTGNLMCLGRKPQFTNWNNGNPHRDQGQDCISMRERRGGKWGDSFCKNRKFVACEMRDPPRPAYCLQADSSGRFTSRCLLNHVIKNLTTTTGISGCGQACWAEPRCHSFNILGQDAKTSICQLNSASSFIADLADLKDVKNCYFFDL